MRTFELVSQHLGVDPSKNVFFPLFTVQRGMEKGAGSGWVSFRQNEKMFDIFAGKVRSWKEHYFLVRPKSVAALNNLLRSAGPPTAEDDKAPARVPYFPLEWCNDHYNLRRGDFHYSLDRLNPEERVPHDKL